MPNKIPGFFQDPYKPWAITGYNMNTHFGNNNREY